MEITKREILVSITIVAIWISIGLFIAGRINDWQQDKNMEYEKAARIERQDLFEHGMATNLGNAFVYGTLEAKEPVTYPDIKGEYSYIRKEKERYTMHTRTVTYTTGSGSNRQTHTRMETYWTWDVVNVEEKRAKELIFLENTFSSGLVDLPGADYIDIVKESGYVRYVYYGVPAKMNGTLCTTLADGTIREGSKFYDNKTIDETVDTLVAESWIFVFWIIWLFLLGVGLFWFYRKDNDWLEG